MGAKRVLNRVFYEMLVDVNIDEHMPQYSIDDGPSPVSKEDVKNHVGVIQISSLLEGSGTLLAWSSSWDARVDDAIEFCHGIYVALQGELQKSFS